MLADQRKCSLLRPKRGTLLDPDLGPLAMSPIGRENRHIGIDPKRIVPPMTRGDHSTVKIHDPLQLLAIEGGNWAPVPDGGERRDDAQALLTSGRR